MSFKRIYFYTENSIKEFDVLFLNEFRVYMCLRTVTSVKSKMYWRLKYHNTTRSTGT